MPIWPTANWLEREVFDMFGIKFDGHPDLKRILLPEGWKGHPLRKDYGIIQQDNEWVQINLGIESGTMSAESNDRRNQISFAPRSRRTDKTFLDSNELIINMGPQHPATHGVLRVILKLDGEKVLGTECVIGYLHRGVEKIAENRTYTMFNPYVDRMDYVAAVSNGLGYCEAVEKLLNVEAPPRAQLHSRDPDRAEPHGQPHALAGHARARYRRHHAAVLHLPRQGRDSQDFRKVLRRAA